MLKRIAPVKHQLRKLIREDETVKEAYLQIAFAPRRGIANACYCFDAELINEFTSMGIDIALSIQIMFFTETSTTFSEIFLTRLRVSRYPGSAGESFREVLVA